MSAVLAVAFPVFAVIAAGLVAGRFGFASAADSAALNRFVFRFAMPAALFDFMSGAPGLGRADFLLALAYGAPAFAVMAAGYFVGRRIFSQTPPVAGAFAFAASVGNAVFLGLPIALAVEGWARPFVVLMLVEGILLIGVGAALMGQPEERTGMRPGKAAMNFLARPFKTPIVVGALAGFALASLNLALPAPLAAFFDLIGRAAGPTALFSLGLFLATHPMPPVKRAGPEIAAIAAFKMLALPALALALAGALGVADPHYRAALALFTVTPVAIGAFVMASGFGRYVEETVAAIAVTTALALLSISTVLALFA